jgi:hypothetical protein
MTPDQIEDVIERTATRTAEKIKDEVRGMFTALGFNMAPDRAHEEQQMIAFARGLYQGKKVGIKATIAAIATALVGWGMWFFTGRPHP